jgi:hypothetical protein
MIYCIMIYYYIITCIMIYCIADDETTPYASLCEVD